MSGSEWMDWYSACWDALVAKVVALEEFDTDTVIYGFKGTIEKYPTCYVCPGNTDITPASLNRYDNRALFEFGVVVEEESNPKDGYLAVLLLVGKIYDAVCDDKKLGELVDQLEPTTIEPNWRGMGVKGEKDFWCGFSVELTRYML
jgi:hypothetical protein